MKRRPHLLLLLLLFAASGCTIGYRHTRHGTTLTRDDGRQLEIDGQGNSVQLGATFDFRYFRFMLPFEGSYRLLRFRDEDGNPDRSDIIREQRFYRLDVPVLSLWSEDGEGLQYPGNMRHRKNSLELWLSGSTDAQFEPEWWVDVGLAWYRYNKLGLRFYIGGGAVPFRASTPQIGSRFPILWEGYAPMLGAGIEMTFTTGEFALDALDYLVGIDKRHRERSRRYGWD